MALNKKISASLLISICLIGCLNTEVFSQQNNDGFKLPTINSEYSNQYKTLILNNNRSSFDNILRNLEDIQINIEKDQSVIKSQIENLEKELDLAKNEYKKVNRELRTINHIKKKIQKNFNINTPNSKPFSLID